MINLFLAMIAQAAMVAAPSTDITATLRAKDQALLDAIAPGDRALWDKTLTDDAVYVDENGAIIERAPFLKELVPLPTGASGRIQIIDYNVRLHGDTALVRHRDDEREIYHGQTLHAEYLTTETWLRQAGAWKLASVHTYVVAVDPPAIPLPAASLDAYVGVYTLADMTYTVARDGDHLTGLASGGKARPLMAETADVFFSPGRPRTRMIFQHDVSGRIVRVIDRREGEDLVYTRKVG
jgi:ketosteroid isomerase-like protein